MWLEDNIECRCFFIVISICAKYLCYCAYKNFYLCWIFLLLCKYLSVIVQIFFLYCANIFFVIVQIFFNRSATILSKYFSIVVKRFRDASERLGRWCFQQCPILVVNVQVLYRSKYLLISVLSFQKICLWFCVWYGVRFIECGVPLEVLTPL